MLSIVWRRRRSAIVGSCKDHLQPAEGLRILTQLSSNSESNIVFKSGSKLIKPSFHLNQIKPPPINCCFLKSCFLCKKQLSLDKEVYMYRGDQGFCSVECRSRQMYIDEIQEIEISTKKVLAAYRRPRRRCETSNHFLEELHTFSSQKNPVIFFS